MSLIINCPLPDAIPNGVETDCPEIFGQISKIAFQKIQSAPSFTKTTVGLKATWTPLLTAVGDTKVVLSPLISNFVIPASALLSEGGNDNTTINGIRNVRGLGTVTATGILKNITALTKKAIQDLFPFTKAPAPGITLLWAYFITTDGKVICKSNGEGFPVYNLALTDPKLEGFNKDNDFDLSLDMEGGWSDDFMTVHTDFKPMTFKNPVA